MRTLPALLPAALAAALVLAGCLQPAEEAQAAPPAAAAQDESCRSDCPGTFFRGHPSGYLKARPYSRWVIEVDYTEGHKPAQDLLDFLKGRLEGVADKPDGIEFHLGDALPAEARKWGADLAPYASLHQDEKTRGRTVVTHLLFLAGGTASDQGQSRVLGAAYGRSPVVVFDDNVRAACAVPEPVCSTAPVYRSVLAHEFGHALGLVNNGIRMLKPHEDAAHPGHSSNKGSVMYWAVESNEILQLLGQVPPDDFDADDRADLKAAGGK